MVVLAVVLVCGRWCPWGSCVNRGGQAGVGKFSLTKNSQLLRCSTARWLYTGLFHVGTTKVKAHKSFLFLPAPQINSPSLNSTMHTTYCAPTPIPDLNPHHVSPGYIQISLMPFVFWKHAPWDSEKELPSADVILITISCVITYMCLRDHSLMMSR